MGSSFNFFSISWKEFISVLLPTYLATIWLLWEEAKILTALGRENENFLQINWRGKRNTKSKELRKLIPLNMAYHILESNSSTWATTSLVSVWFSVIFENPMLSVQCDKFWGRMLIILPCIVNKWSALCCLFIYLVILNFFLILQHKLGIVSGIDIDKCTVRLSDWKRSILRLTKNDFITLGYRICCI